MSVDELRQGLAALLPQLRRFARTLAWQREDADDLVQAAMERALKAEAQWERGTRLDAWVYRIMKNAWIDELRSRGRRGEVMVDIDDEVLNETVGESDTGALVTRLSVQKAVQRLPEEQRLAVSLVLVEGLSYREAAETLDIPVGTLTSRLARGREALQAVLIDGDLQ